MDIGIIGSPASPNLCLALERANMRPLASPDNLEACAGYILLDTPTHLDILTDQMLLGKPLLGIAKGAEFLVKSGWIPGVENLRPVITLAEHPYPTTVTLNPVLRYQYNAFTRLIKKETQLTLTLDTAKQFLIPPGLLMELQENGLLIFEESKNVMAISNKTGNIMAILPHPESHPSGDTIFQSMRDYIERGYRQHVLPLHYYPR